MRVAMNDDARGILTLAAALLVLQTSVRAEAPAAPVNVSCCSHDVSKGFTCTWDLVEGGDPPYNVTVTYSNILHNNGREMECVLSAGGRSCAARRVQLYTGKPYHVTVRAWNADGEDTASISFVFDAIVKPDPPVALNVTQETDSVSTLHVRWAAPDSWSNPENELSYRLRYRSLPQWHWKEINVNPSDDDKNEYEQLITNAQPSTEHIIQVAARYRDWWSEWSEELRLTPWTQTTSEGPVLMATTFYDDTTWEDELISEDPDGDATAGMDNSVIYAVAGVTGVLILLLLLGSRLCMHRRTVFETSNDAEVNSGKDIGGSLNQC